MTQKEKLTLVNIFKNNPYCEIRDTLIEYGFADETFPHFYHDIEHGLSVKKYNNKGYVKIGDMLFLDGKIYRCIDVTNRT